MFARITRSLIAFGVVFVVYQAYALIVVPLVEPAGVRASSFRPTVPDRANPVDKYQDILASYFDKEHWSLAGKPKVIETGQLMLVIEDYRRDNRGRVDLTKCAVVAFPTPRQAGSAPPRDAVIIEAEGGARLQFDSDFNPSRGRIGRIVSGQFPGKIIIRSDMNEPGEEDDLRIETREMWMDTERIFTPNEVEFHLGGNHLEGRKMDITLLQEEFQRPGEGGLGFGGVEQLEIFHVEKMELQVGNLSLSEDGLGDGARNSPPHVRQTSHSAPSSGGAGAWAEVGTKSSVYDATHRAKTSETPQPIVVTCARSFQLSLLDFTATFNKQVVATQLSLTGQSDQLQCDTLKIGFSDEQDHLSPTDDPDFVERQRSTLGRLQPTYLEAIGQPVQIDSPSRGAYARANRLKVDIDRRRLTLQGGSPVLSQGGSQVSAPVIRYEHPAEGEQAAIGQLWLAGPGSIRIVPKLANPQEAVEAQWNAVPGIKWPVQLTRVEGRPVLMVEGRPQFSAARMGRLTSDRLRVALREVPADGREGPAIELGNASENQLALLPERIDAVGAVQIDSSQLVANTQKLAMLVRPQENQPALGDARGGGDNAGDDPRDRSAKKTYTLTTQAMQMDLLLRGRRATPANLVCQGQVEFREKPSASAAASTRSATPLSVTGQRLHVSDLSSGAIELQVTGATGAASGGAALAEIVAQGMTLRSSAVNLSQKNNRVWADGAGAARVRVQRDLLGQSTTAATDLHLRWRGGLNFDGQRITVRDEVFGEGPHDWVRCEEVVATLTRRVDFTHSPGGRDIEIAQVDCLGGVTIDHRTIDPQGQRSHERAKINSISINQTTGDFSGVGPGWVRSVRLAERGGGLGAIGRSGQQPSGEASLQFLRVNFLRGISGNLNRRTISFLGNVQTVYGPVLAWEKELPLVHPNGPPADTATLRCDRLTVNEDPLVGYTRRDPTRGQGMGPMEMHAHGSVQVQGAAEGRGLFTAYASAASYSQSKDEIVLEGDGRSPAKLFQQDAPGSQPRSSEAQSLSYRPSTGEVNIANFSHGTSGSSSATAPRMGPPRR